jgi:hypothetical protein
VPVRVRGTAEEVRAGLPAAVAIVATEDGGAGGESWCRVEMRVERLDWVPGVLASLDRPFVVERPAELRGLVADLAGRLLEAARHPPPGD